MWTPLEPSSSANLNCLSFSSPHPAIYLFKNKDNRNSCAEPRWYATGAAETPALLRWIRFPFCAVICGLLLWSLSTASPSPTTEVKCTVSWERQCASIQYIQFSHLLGKQELASVIKFHPREVLSSAIDINGGSTERRFAGNKRVQLISRQNRMRQEGVG
jgi:hypothetical protein